MTNTDPQHPDGTDVASLVADVVHDLNNVLLVIRGYSTVLLSTLEAPEHLADVEEIKRAGDTASGLTKRLLEITGSSTASASASTAEAPSHGTETILLVDDEDQVRDLVRRLLENAGYRVVTASCPSDAQAALDAEPEVDLLVTDVVMPEMNGFELASLLARRRPGLRALFVSGNAYVAAGSMRPDADLLKKPFDASDLIRAVRRSLDAAPAAISS